VAIEATALCNDANSKTANNLGFLAGAHRATQRLS
jgi:hypothetical protein